MKSRGRIAAQSMLAGGVELRHRPNALLPRHGYRGGELSQLVCRAFVNVTASTPTTARRGSKRAEVHHAQLRSASLVRMLGITLKSTKGRPPSPRRHPRCRSCPSQKRFATRLMRNRRRLPLPAACALSVVSTPRRWRFCKIPRNGRFSRSGMARVKILHCFHLSRSFHVLPLVTESLRSDQNRLLFVPIFVDTKNVCSIYNRRTKILSGGIFFPWLLPHLFFVFIGVSVVTTK